MRRNPAVLMIWAFAGLATIFSSVISKTDVNIFNYILCWFSLISVLVLEYFDD